MMNICLVSREFPPQTGWGGIGTYYWELAHGLAELGNQVDVICQATGKGGSKQIADGVRVHRIKLAPYSRITWSLYKHLTKLTIFDKRYPLLLHSFRWSWSAAIKVQELCQYIPIDLVECPEVKAEGLFVKLITNLPLAIKLHTPCYWERTLNGFTVNNDIRFLSWLEYLTLQKADLVTSCSYALVKLLRPTWKRLPEVKVIPNPIDHHLFQPNPKITNNSELIIGYFGRLEQRKGVDILFEAFKQVVKSIPHVQLWLVGEDQNRPNNNETWGEYIRQHATQLGIINRIQFWGKVKRSELPDLLTKCDICVIPSKQFENFPYTCLEAMSCGKPVIASACGGISEMVEDGISGLLVKPSNVSELVDAIIKLSSAEKRIELAKFARQRIEEQYTRDKIVLKIQNLYQETLFKNQG